MSAHVDAITHRAEQIGYLMAVNDLMDHLKSLGLDTAVVAVALFVRARRAREDAQEAIAKAGA